MSPIRMSKLESGMRIALEFNEAFNRQDVDSMMQLVSDDCILESTIPAPDGTVYSGKEAVTNYWQHFFQGSPQAHIKIEEIFGFGRRVVMRWIYSWEQVDGERGYVRGVDILRVSNDLISEQLSYVKGK